MMQCLWWKVRGLKNKVNVEEASFKSYVPEEGKEYEIVVD